VADGVALAARIEQVVPPDRDVLAFGTASSMNFLSRRRQPTRFFYAPVVVAADQALSSPAFPMAEKWVRWFDQDLTLHPPYWCLVGSDSSAWLKGTTPAASRLRRLLEAYRKTGTVGTMTLYEPR
jgi:hypothetical protein